MDVPDIRFAAARGGRVAYQDFGNGEEVIVAIPPAAQNVEAAWERAEVRAMLERFASFCRFIPFDKLGTGASDRSRLVSGIDERVDELRSVMDEVGVEQAHLFAQSEGGPTTLMFAATYPHRVKSVILVGSAARFMDDDRDREQSKAARIAYAEVWGTPDSIAVDLFAPSMADDAEFRAWHQRYERMSASSDSVRDLMLQMMDIDVREILPEVDVPVLVISRADDESLPVEWGREIADLVPGAEFVVVPGRDHFAYLGDLDSWMDLVERHVTGSVAERPVAAPSSDVLVQTLGRFVLTVGGDEVPSNAWGSKRARTLLKRLVVARGWPVTRTELTDLLWPDEVDDTKLSARLSVQLSMVRKVLGGGIIADRETVAVDLSHVEVDVEALLDSTDDAEIVVLYTGEFLPEERYEDWADPTRHQARNHFTRAAHRLAATALEAGDTTTSIDLLRRVVEADPTDETAFDLLARSYDVAGDEAAAERVRQRLDELLKDF